jgi:Spy/CpxP family protein refolding chaperone
MKQKLLIVSVIAFALQASINAQGGPPPGMRGVPGGFGAPGGESEISLLGRNDVQEDLQLTADQKNKVQALVKKYQPQRGPGGGPGGGQRGGGQGGPPGGPPMGGPGGSFDPEGMRAEMEKRQAEQKKAIATVLTESQIKRLGEIKVQMQGNMAVFDPEIQKKLNISDEQKDKLEVAMDEQRENMRPPDFGNGERPDPKQMQEQMKKMQAQMSTAIDGILSTNQKARLRELGGKAFKRVDPQPGQGQGPRGGGF